MRERERLWEKRSQEKDEKEQSRTQAVDNVLPREHGTNVETAESAFQKAVNETARHAIRAGLLQFRFGRRSSDRHRQGE